MGSILEEREKMILKSLKKLRYCHVLPICWLAGYTDLTYIRKRLNKLADAGYIKILHADGRYIYTLSAKGYYELESPSRALEYTYNTNHELDVAYMAAYLYTKYGYSLADMQTDESLRASKGYIHKNSRRIHFPDLVVDDIAYEIERNYKKKDRLYQKLQQNAEQYTQQIWVLPKHKPTLKKNIHECAQKLHIEDKVKIIIFEEMLRELYTEYDIHSNQLREKKAAQCIVLFDESRSKGKKNSILDELKDM